MMFSSKRIAAVLRSSCAPESFYRIDQEIIEDAGIAGGQLRGDGLGGLMLSIRSA